MFVKSPKLIVILGPTATGKTKLAVDLASKFNGEIVSADSRQIYKGMDIGTGKDMKEYKKIKYHLINVVNPNTNYNLVKYKRKALKTIKDITKRNKIPFLVGGTGLYISSIIDNYQIPPVKPDKKIREKINKLDKNEQIKLLMELDRESLKFIDTDNPRRLERALEVCLNGQKFSTYRRKQSKPLFNVLQIGLTFPREEINKKINKRVDEMIKTGLIKETEKIIKKYGRKSAPLETIGYTEIIDYLNKKTIPLSGTIQLIKTHTHQFAKRQMTWFKRDRNINWVKNKTQANKLIRKFLNQ
ncbi:MAG: tRNA (adenosine(37)-N6)-dimethylallyltransferase MiaA [Patescibacteria group bacterium]